VCTFLLISSAIFSISTANAQGPDGPEAITVYLTEEQAIKKIFPDADTLWTEVWTPTQQERRRIERRLGWRLEETEFTIFQAKKNNQHQGYAIITHQIGLYKPITFMVHVKIDGRVGSVWIMVYRESRGGQVRRQRFLTQYKNKKTDSHIRLNRDIVGISGATLSVRALNAGVKKILTVIDVAYSQKESP
jgi:Na+-translocating ferredoxin:NAD+ oxidoreductase RnfG subunit